MKLDQPGKFALIIGAMKCGTTAIYNLLATHPQLCGCSEKEPDFFTDDEKWLTGADGYKALWPDWSSERHLYALEGSTSYTKMPTFPNVAERIASFPDATFKFIYSIRDPVDRIESHVSHGIHYGWSRPSEKGIDPSAVHISRFAMQINPYLRFGRENILILFQDDFRRDPRGQLRNICRFLGIDQTYEFDLTAVETNRRADHVYKRLLDPRSPLSLRLRLRALVGQLFGMKHLNPGFIPETDKAILRAQLRPELDQLADGFGIDRTRLLRWMD